MKLFNYSHSACVLFVLSLLFLLLARLGALRRGVGLGLGLLRGRLGLPRLGARAVEVLLVVDLAAVPDSSSELPNLPNGPNNEIDGIDLPN